MVARKRVTQESFDDVITENMETFDMSREEAVKSAVEEFELQGAELSGIMKQDPNELRKHPVAAALAAVSTARQSSEGAGKLPQALHDLQQTLHSSPDKSDAPEEALAVAVSQGAVKELLACCKAAVSEAHLAAPAAGALTAVLASDGARDEFAEQNGSMALKLLLDKSQGSSVGSIAACIEAASNKSEASKCAFVDEGTHVLLIGAIREPGITHDALRPICGALRSFSTADDLRPTTSRAFQNGRAIAKAGAPEAMLKAMRDHMASGAHVPQIPTAVCSALRRIAVNDDICMEFADAGGVTVTMQAVQRYMQDAQASRACLGLLRQLANSDAIKTSIVSASGLELINQAVSCHVTSAGPLEQALGLLGTLMLRNPEAAELAAESGCIDSCVEAMQACERDNFTDSATGTQWVARQACMALRNMVARSPQLRPAVLEKGCERLLRCAKHAYPATCADVGAAALRDLGFDDYNA